MYTYFSGVIILSLVWVVLFIKCPLWRRRMTFSSFLCLAVLIPLFFITKALSYVFLITWKYVPDYYNPDTLFDLSRITGGAALEDVVFIFLMGGIAAVIYQMMTKNKKIRAQPHIIAIFLFVISYIIIGLLYQFNPIYNLSLSSVIGFLVISLQRHDLCKPAVYGGILFGIVWLMAAIVFANVFLEGAGTFLALQNLTGVLILGAPLEEFIWGFTFGLMWVPIYAYIKGV